MENLSLLRNLKKIQSREYESFGPKNFAIDLTFDVDSEKIIIVLIRYL